ncbi:hypothetical protein I4U23_014017 [Adineta vaga]|nr:hypothetical protein I4U23_014017 [Adineta vaga]
MSDVKDCLILTVKNTPTKSKFEMKSRRIQIIKNFIYLISFLDFLLHYAITIELGLFEQIYQLFHQILPSNSTAVSLCRLPMAEYLSFHISQISLYILYFSFFTLLLSIEAIRKSSFHLYRIYILMKFTFAMFLLIFYTIHTLINLKMAYIQSTVSIPHSHDADQQSDSIFISIDTCLIHTRERIAISLLTILNVFVFVISVECSKVFPFLKKNVIKV